MGPEWAALDKAGFREKGCSDTCSLDNDVLIPKPYKVLLHSAELYVHRFIRKCPVILKDAINFIDSDELYLRQTYKK